MTQGQLSQESVKALAEGAASANIAQIATKAIADGSSDTRLSQITTKALVFSNPPAIFTQLAVKVLVDYIDAVEIPRGIELQLEDNPYIQSYAQATRLTRMVYDFYHTNRAIITLEGVGYDPDRYLGEVVELTNAEWGITAARHRIIALDYTNGATMKVMLAPIEGLPTRSDVFIVNETYDDADIRKVSY